MKFKPSDLSAVLRSRRSVFPPTYIDRPIDREILEEILENANWAPTHKKTEPWRFRVLRGAALKRLGHFLADWYRQNTPTESFSEKKYEKNLRKPQRSACVIAICMQRDPQERIPEWEEVAATACAVQNMWLTCHTYGIGAYWSSPKAIGDAGDLLELQEGERCLGFFFMGYHELPDLPGTRSPIADKVTWIDQ